MKEILRSKCNLIFSKCKTRIGTSQWYNAYQKQFVELTSASWASEKESFSLTILVSQALFLYFSVSVSIFLLQADENTKLCYLFYAYCWIYILQTKLPFCRSNEKIPSSGYTMQYSESKQMRPFTNSSLPMWRMLNQNLFS